MSRQHAASGKPTAPTGSICSGLEAGDTMALSPVPDAKLRTPATRGRAMSCEGVAVFAKVRSEFCQLCPA